MGNALSAAQEMHLHELFFLLQKHAIPVPKSTLTALLQTIHSVCPFYPQGGTLNVSDWEKRGMYLHKPPRASIDQLNAWHRIMYVLKQISQPLINPPPLSCSDVAIPAPQPIVVHPSAPPQYTSAPERPNKEFNLSAMQKLALAAKEDGEEDAQLLASVCPVVQVRNHPTHNSTTNPQSTDSKSESEKLIERQAFSYEPLKEAPPLNTNQARKALQNQSAIPYTEPMQVYQLSSQFMGSPPNGAVTLVLPHSTDTDHEQHVIPKVINTAQSGSIDFQIYTSCPKTINKGETIEQIVIVPCTTPSSQPIECSTPACDDGSAKQSLAAAITHLDPQHRPFQTLWVGGQLLNGLQDTCANLAVLPPSHWAPHWEEETTSPIWGVEKKCCQLEQFIHNT